MDLDLVPARDADRPVVENLVSYYIYDFTEFMDWPCPESGRYGGCDQLLADLEAGTNHVFLLRVAGELAGFAAVSDDDATGGRRIQEFFVLRKFRHRGVGKAVAIQLFDRFPDQWTVEYLVDNTPAARFWPRVIATYTNGRFTDAGVTESPWGHLATLRFETPPQSCPSC